MKHLEIDYANVEMESRKHAGLDGVSFGTPEHGTIATIFVNDTSLISAIDEALRKKYRKDDE